MSLEQEPPKLLWLRRHLRQACWDRAAHFFDLPDFLTLMATGDPSRSYCSTVCKWAFKGHHASGESGWVDSFWRAADLGDLVEDGYQRIGTQVLPIGETVGRGLTASVASLLGLREGTPVGVSMIDAHAGGIGVLGAPLPAYDSHPQPHPHDDGMAEQDEDDLSKRLALIAGTSSCHLAVSREPRFVPGVWGPYYSAMIPGYWLNEGGQTTAGSLIDHVISGYDLGTLKSLSAEPAPVLLNLHLDEMAARAGVPVACERLPSSLSCLWVRVVRADGLPFPLSFPSVDEGPSCAALFSRQQITQGGPNPEGCHLRTRPCQIGGQRGTALPGHGAGHCGGAGLIDLSFFIL